LAEIPPVLLKTFADRDLDLLASIDLLSCDPKNLQFKLNVF